eukprot:scaffold71507_cov35-Attheya_sp.AAC.2
MKSSCVGTQKWLRHHASSLVIVMMMIKTLAPMQLDINFVIPFRHCHRARGMTLPGTYQVL